MRPRLIACSLATTFVVLAAGGLAEEPKGDKAKTQPVKLAADLIAQAPAAWKAQETKKQFRTHEFVFPSSEKGAADGFMMVTHFGKGGGGDIDSNLRRWYGMVEQPDGSSTEKAAKKHEIKIDAGKIVWLDLSGTYLDRPFPASPDVTKRPKYRVFAAMIDAGAEGPYWIRAWGPEAVMASHRDGFEQFLKSVAKK